MTITAEYRDTWAGWTLAKLVSFKTKRNGQSVVMYRWQQENGQHCVGGFVSHSVDVMLAYAKRNPLFRVA